ncbi:hypothetical protein ACFQ3S_14810 [Mucilaginibacter terrae]|uniref:hypothetical protein n=1 Tax=Mucilaginibacter terrae TaxID=1955052 RepID=UPI003641EFA6
MAKIREMVMAVNHVKMDDEDSVDVAFWLSKTPGERLEEVYRLRQRYFTWANGSFPTKIEKAVHQKKMKINKG